MWARALKSIYCCNNAAADCIRPTHIHKMNIININLVFLQFEYQKDGEIGTCAHIEQVSSYFRAYILYVYGVVPATIIEFIL